MRKWDGEAGLKEDLILCLGLPVDSKWLTNTKDCLCFMYMCVRLRLHLQQFVSPVAV